VAKKTTLKQKNPLTRYPGRPERITDDLLVSARNHLVYLFESTWGDVGWYLTEIRERRSADVRLALQSWRAITHSHYAVEVLLRESHCSADAITAESMRRNLAKLHNSIQEA
jgi:hypothetical protein